MSIERLHLKRTHVLVYRQLVATIVFSLLVGIGNIFFPDLFFNSKNYDAIIGQLFIPQIWGGIWLIVAGIMATVFFGVKYKVTQIGIILFSMICLAWALGLALLPIVIGQTSGTGAAIWGLIAVRSFFLALEPPINPATAIKLDNTKED